MAELRAEWKRLGVSFAVEGTAEVVDVEDLLWRTTGHVQEDPRLFWGAASWLARYGSLVDGRRLVARVHEAPERSALLAGLIVASRDPHLKSLLKSLQPWTTPRPLFRVVEDTPCLLAKTERAALPAFRRLGLLVDEWSLCPDAIRPPSWVLRNNPTLLARAILGPGLRTELLTRLMERSSGATAAELARSSGRQYSSVHAALRALCSSGLLSDERDGRRRRYRVPAWLPSWLNSYPGALRPAEREDAAA